VPAAETRPKANLIIDEPGFKVEEVPDEEEVLENMNYNFDPTLDLSSYQYPSAELLKEYEASKVQVTKEELEANKDKIVATLSHYNIGIASIKATIGPTVTLYEIVPEAGVRISKIKNLEDDIALSLSALGIRIIAPMPGKGTIGIEVPNSNKEMVSIRSVLATEKFMKSDRELPVVFGKTISNEIFVADLAKMPHILIAGATGQGKSVGLNVLLTSLIYKKHPSQLKFVLVDPKKVELSLFNKLERHFLAKLPNSDEAIITDTKKVIHTLNSLCMEMDQRYDLLKEANCRNLKEYNTKFVERKLNPEKGHRFMPYIVLVIDELADLMMTAGKEVETPIARLAQLARAIGIHLVVATQRPSVNVITGIIKANFPARLSFKVTSKVDSRTILDAGGADQLIGQGDMLFSNGSEMVRIQCAFVDTPEVEDVCDFIGNQRGYTSAYMLPEYHEEGDGEGGGSFDMSQKDEMFEEAARLIVAHQQGSTSLIQRRLKLGYNRAGRLIDQLESAGIVGPFEGSKAREVLVKDEYSLEQLLNELNGKKNS
jgi:DNA segregation ATPase FtsK/SpoIIIE, S-DNA-T family